MDERARLKRNEYNRKWRRENPERVRAINERYWLKKAGEFSGVSREVTERK